MKQPMMTVTLHHQFIWWASFEKPVAAVAMVATIVAKIPGYVRAMAFFVGAAVDGAFPGSVRARPTSRWITFHSTSGPIRALLIM